MGGTISLKSKIRDFLVEDGVSEKQIAELGFAADGQPLWTRAPKAKRRPEKTGGGKTGKWGRGSTRYTKALAERMLDDLSAGRSLRAVCDDADAPCIFTWQAWIRKYDWLREAYIAERAGRRAHAIERQKVPYDPAIAAYICDEVASGRPPTSVSDDVDVPGVVVIRRWKLENPDFADAMQEARREWLDVVEGEVIPTADRRDLDSKSKQVMVTARLAILGRLHPQHAEKRETRTVKVSVKSFSAVEAYVKELQERVNKARAELTAGPDAGDVIEVEAQKSETVPG